MFVLVMCMLVWLWRGQAVVGLEELRARAVRSLLLTVRVVEGCLGVALAVRLMRRLRAFDCGVVYYHHSDVCEVAWCEVKELWMLRAGSRPSLCVGGFGRRVGCLPKSQTLQPLQY